MPDRNVYPLSLESFVRLIDAAGYKKHTLDAQAGRVTFDVQGEETVLRVHVMPGKTTENDDAWYVRFLAYSLQFEPAKAGVPVPSILDWMNRKNRDLIFGRYYYDDSTDTVAFEVAVPCNGGLLGEDFDDLLRISTLSVDRTHADLKKLMAE